MSIDKANQYKQTLEKLLIRYDLPEKISNENINDILPKEGALNEIWGFSFRDLSNVDFSWITEESFVNIGFNNYTIFPKDFKINHKKIIEEAKDPGLFIRDLHKRGIDGRGVTVAVIDGPFLETHNELAGRVVKSNYINPEHRLNNKMQYHGLVCSSFLCGNFCGVANGANLHYYVCPIGLKMDNYSYVFKALDMIKKYNQKSSTEEKIKIIMLPTSFPDEVDGITEKFKMYITELEESGCYFICVNSFIDAFIGASKMYIGNANDFDAYIYDVTWQPGECEGKKILIPAGGRTCPVNSGNDDYMYLGNKGSFSWALSYICGVFALALQVKSDLTYKDFYSSAVKTAYKNSVDLLTINPIGIIDKCQTK